MVFPTVPAYLDPNIWPQQQNPQHGSCSENPQIPQPPSSAAAGAGSSSIRPSSMSEQARLAKLPPPEAALKCPRCSSTNTKFCYFNNYSLSQPRHFCKTCRRYWTKGGALRNVPVGGGCRRSKKSKGSSSKSPATSDQQASGGCSSFSAEAISRIPPPLLPSQLPFMPSLSYGTSDMRLNYGGIQMAGGGSDMGFPICGNPNTFGSILTSATEQWRLQQQVHQPHYLGGLEHPAGLYPMEGERAETGLGMGGAALIRSLKPSSSLDAVRQSSPVKIEENQGLNPQYLSGNPWTDLSSFASSSGTGSRLL